MKVRISIWRTLPALLGLVLVAGGIIFALTFNLFLKPITQWNWAPYTIIGIWLATSIALIVLNSFMNYYEIYRKYVVVHKGFRKLIYYYSDVVYIDEEKSERKKMIHFVTRHGHARYLYFDSKNLLYPAFLQYCKNRLSYEEYKMKFPQVKL